MEEKLIKPIMIVPEGVCPRCMSTISIFESEIVEMQLDEEGLPISHDIKYNRMYGRCPSCGLDRFEIKKEGMHYSISSKLLDTLNEEHLKYLKNKSNPFGYKEEE